MSLKNKLKKKIEDLKDTVIADPFPLVIIGVSTALVGYWYAGYKWGKVVGALEEVAAHGPCIEIDENALEGLLKGMFCVIKFDGPDILYKLVSGDSS